MDRAGWTALQVATADAMAADAAAHDAANEHDDAEADLANTTGEVRRGWSGDIQSATAHERAAAERLAVATRQAEQARVALAQVQRLTRKQFADRAGVAPDTLSSYVARGQAPEPDGRDEHGHPWWLEVTVETYLRTRPGQGARTDLGRRS